MTNIEYKSLTLNQRVSAWFLNGRLQQTTKFGYVTKIYNGNHQVQVWFDGETKPVVMGKTRLELVKD